MSEEIEAAVVEETPEVVEEVEQSYEDAFDQILDEKESVNKIELSEDSVVQDSKEDGEVDSEQAVQESTDPLEGTIDPKEGGSKGSEEEASPELSEMDQLKYQMAEMQRQNLDLAQRARSDAGRVSALTKKLTKVEEDGNAPSLQDSSENVSELFKQYPKIAEAVNDMIGHQLKQVEDQYSTKMEKMEAQQQVAADEMQSRQLDTLVPNWRDVVGDPEFNNWLESQPAGIRNLQASTDVQEIIPLFNLYASHVNQFYPQAGVEHAEERPPSQEKVVENAGIIQEQRKAQASIPLPTPKSGKVTPPAQGEEGMTFEDMFNLAAKQSDKRIQNNRR